MSRKATIVDIAKHALVSPATVDRVLNGRSGVKDRTRQRVLDSADQLGYLVRSHGQALPSKPAQLEFFVPHGSNEFLLRLADLIEEFCERLPLVSESRVHRIPDPRTDLLLDAMDQIDERTAGVGLVATDDPRTRAAIGNLVEAGLRVVTIASDLPATSRAGYVGIDNRSTGRTAGRLMGMMLSPDRPKVAIFLGSRRFCGHAEREAGFRSVLADHFRHLTVVDLLETEEDQARGFDKAMNLLARHPDISGVYIAGGGRRGVVDAVCQRLPDNRPMMFCHELTEQTRQWLLDDRIDIVIDQNARMMAEQSVIHLLCSLASSAPYITRKLISPYIVTPDNILET